MYAIDRTRIGYNFITLVGIAAILGMVFQVGHFLEHALQFFIWCLGDLSQICGRNTPWVSGWALEGINAVAAWFSPTAQPAWRTMMGLEVLHLIGNGIFLSGLVCLYQWVPSKWVRWGCYIEAFHLYEHLMLTSTAYFVGKPIGMSTLFGGVAGLDKEAAVGIRVSWHFAMNLLPMPFAMIGIMEDWIYDKPRTATA